MPPKLIIFDLGGTLMDTAPAVEAAANRVRERKSLGDVPFEEVMSVLAGNGAETDLLVAKEAGGKERRDALMLYGRYLDVVFPDYAKPYPGVSDALPRIRAIVPKMAVMTNAITLFLYQWLEFAGWADLFDPIVGADSVPHSIPSADAFRFVLKRLRVEASESWFISGTREALRAAGDSGIATIGANYGYGSPGANDADVFLDSPFNLLNMLGGAQAI